jgi:hypothetical protein
VRLAWQLAFATLPSDNELAAAVEFRQLQEQSFRDLPTKPKEATEELLALASFCQALLSSNRFLYVE